MPIRPFRPDDAPALAELSLDCARGETDFVLNPLWESVEELNAEFVRFGIEPEEHLLVADAGDDGHVQGMAGFLRAPGERAAGMFCPIVRREERGQGVGGELLRAALDLGRGKLGIELATAGIGTRNRGGYALLTSHGFRPVGQTYLMKCESPPSLPDAPLDGLALAPAEPEDGDAILDLYHASGFEKRAPDRMSVLLADGRHRHAVARKDGELIGFVELETHWPARPWVSFVGVAKGLRDRGVGSFLVAWALAREFEASARSALLALSPANRTALRAYEKVGFRRFRLIDVLERRL
jgi:ribosomal protein S18 acetylase RimI-like enzyme